jgi:ATP-dependent Lhr-like helicase
MEEYDPDNLLIRQAIDEVLVVQVEIDRMRRALKRISTNRIVIRRISRPGPFAFPVIVDRLRAKMSSESVADRIEEMTLDFS